MVDYFSIRRRNLRPFLVFLNHTKPLEDSASALARRTCCRASIKIKNTAPSTCAPPARCYQSVSRCAITSPGHFLGEIACLFAFPTLSPSANPIYNKNLAWNSQRNVRTWRARVFVCERSRFRAVEYPYNILFMHFFCCVFLNCHARDATGLRNRLEVVLKQHAEVAKKDRRHSWVRQHVLLREGVGLQ